MTTYPTPWSVYNPRGTSVYGAEAKCWETAVFDKSGNQVGTALSGTLGYTGRSESTLSKFGLILKQRQIKEYKPPVKKAKSQSQTVSVRSETYDVDGKLIDLTIEHRMVYKTNKGWHIKTRSSGNPYITDEDNWTIRYEQRLVDVRGYADTIRKTIKTVVVSPEEWKKRV
jgi:hypothetical protein